MTVAIAKNKQGGRPEKGSTVSERTDIVYTPEMEWIKGELKKSYAAVAYVKKLEVKCSCGKLVYTHTADQLKMLGQIGNSTLKQMTAFEKDAALVSQITWNVEQCQKFAREVVNVVGEECGAEVRKKIMGMLLLHFPGEEYKNDKANDDIQSTK
jgi:hypothetical protein